MNSKAVIFEMDGVLIDAKNCTAKIQLLLPIT